MDTTNSHGDLAMSLQHVFTCVQVLTYAAEGTYVLYPGEEQAWRGKLEAAINGL